MINRWNDQAAKDFVTAHPELTEIHALRTYSARLIGSDPALVLHGGGNTSAKGTMVDALGRKQRVMWIKGSGGDLATIEPAGHPAVRLDALDALKNLDELSDEAMVNELRLSLLDHKAPTPSIEALVHAFLPHAFVDHTHADAILSLVDQPNSEEILRKIYGSRFAIIPWIMPGFQLSKAARAAYEADPNIEGLLLLKHGIFTFGQTAKESYERMIKAVAEAELFIANCELRIDFGELSRGAKCGVLRTLDYSDRPDRDSFNSQFAFRISQLSSLRGLLLHQEKLPLLHLRTSEKILAFVNHPELEALSQIGPATPDHVIRTKPLPLVLSAPSTHASLDAWKTDSEQRLQAYISNYTEYFQRECAAYQTKKTMLDPLPRIVLIPGVGMVSAAASETAAIVAADVYEHTITIITDAFAIGTYQPLDLHALFEMEYWSLEQAKLKTIVEKSCGRNVVLITGAASGIGRATAQRFAKEGAHLVLVDRNEAMLTEAADAIRRQFKATVLAVTADIGSDADLQNVIERTVTRFGGLDVVILNAGKAFSGTLPGNEAILRESFELNFFAQEKLACLAIDLFKAQGHGGCLLFNASKAAFSPGPGFGPYAIAKASVIALMKQLALDHGADGIRCNAVNADRIATNLFEPSVLKDRLKQRGLSRDEYFSGNLLKQEVTAADVAEAFYFLAQARKTTACTVTVDGGNIGAAPR